MGIQGNEFVDPSLRLEITTYGFTGSDPSDMEINATNNLFNFRVNVIRDGIDNRIHEDGEDATKPVVEFDPFLPSDYESECDSACLGQGKCIFPGFCICEEGWSGSLCDDPTCLSLDFAVAQKLC